MAHTLLEQQWNVTAKETRPMIFVKNILELKTVSENSKVNKFYPINGDIGIGFYGKDSTSSVTNSDIIFSIYDKNENQYNTINGDNWLGSISYHISNGETVKYFKYVLSSEAAENSYTYILAEDANGEWVIFSGDKMYSNYGETGIYNNPQHGGRPEVVDGGNQFMISKARRLDTGVEFKELHFVSSARSYIDTNCIVNFDGKLYRLVSVSNIKDEAGRYPAFAFPVSD